MHKLFQELKALTELNGIVSNEKEVSTFLQKAIQLDAKKDYLGSLVYSCGKGMKVMLSAHIDEVGMMVTQITPDGFIKFQTVGKLSGFNLVNQKFLVTTKTNKLLGVINANPNHFNDKDLNQKNLYLDLGFKSLKDAQTAGISVGDMITPFEPLQPLDESKVFGKALDNRLGVLALKEILNKKLNLNVNLNVAFTVQGEVGIKGAKTTAFMVEPDLAISIEAIPASDTPGGEKTGNQLGMGPQIVFYDSGLIAHHGLRNYVIEIAKMYQIPYQETSIQHDASDAAQISLSKSGAASLVIGIPVRYTHSHTSVADLKDLEYTISLLEKVLASLDDQKITQILY